MRRLSMKFSVVKSQKTKVRLWYNCRYHSRILKNEDTEVRDYLLGQNRIEMSWWLFLILLKSSWLTTHLIFIFILSFIPVKTTVYGYKSSGKEKIVNASLLNSENGANKCTLALWSQIFNFAAVWIKYVLYKGGTHGSKLLTKIVSQF